jgi:hypothetical protein
MTKTFKMYKLDKDVEREFDNFMLEEYGKWKIGRTEAKQFLASKLAEQKSNILKEVGVSIYCIRKRIRLRMIKEANTPLKERKNGWDILKEVQDILNKIK